MQRARQWLAILPPGVTSLALAHTPLASIPCSCLSGEFAKLRFLTGTTGGPGLARLCGDRCYHWAGRNPDVNRATEGRPPPESHIS